MKSMEGVNFAMLKVIYAIWLIGTLLTYFSAIESNYWKMGSKLFTGKFKILICFILFVFSVCWPLTFIYIALNQETTK